MAEWSKAPDSRGILPEHSGPRMWAWVRTPLLTKTFWHIFFFSTKNPFLTFAYRIISKFKEEEMSLVVGQCQGIYNT
jgi:hypothetical protein